MTAITEEHIRFATGKQLAYLIGTNEQTVCGWTRQKVCISGRLLERAARRGIPKEVLIKGLDARRRDAEVAMRLQEELDSLLGQDSRKLEGVA